ncbi:LuxR C-terminal-related transcriptional regulator [Streptomyces sp. NPDC093568]|uniref:LuxR C-terminal-related transcriptional regulator n=1 Tax=Streptomyces sp. NPDC093568 TaxID=3366041 RepID=UPI0038195964
MDLTAAVDVIRAPLSEILPRLSAALDAQIPHSAVAELASNCPYSPFKTHGESPGRPGSAITTGDVEAARGHVAGRGTWHGRVRMAGAEVPVLVLGSDMTERGAWLVLVRTDDTPVPADRLAAAQAMWDLVTAHRERMVMEAVPGTLGPSRAAAAARAAAIAELDDAHGASLSALLDVLRRRDLDDATARSRAIELASLAMVDLRSHGERDQALVEERTDHAFARLADTLRPLLRARGVRLDLGTPGAEEGADRVLPADVSHTAQAVVRAVVHAALDDQGPGPGPGDAGDDQRVRRVHIAWKADAGELRATVRDDGPGILSRAALDRRRVGERLSALGGRVDLDAVPGWGTTVTVRVPLAPPQTPREDPLTALGERELEVLRHLARGRRNRDIAQELHISESTVKYHVANILEKLGVASRGEAAALAHEWGAAAG